MPTRPTPLTLISPSFLAVVMAQTQVASQTWRGIRVGASRDGTQCQHLQMMMPFAVPAPPIYNLRAKGYGAAALSEEGARVVCRRTRITPTRPPPRLPSIIRCLRLASGAGARLGPRAYLGSIQFQPLAGSNLPSPATHFLSWALPLPVYGIC